LQCLLAIGCNHVVLTKVDWAPQKRLYVASNRRTGFWKRVH
jgi:hypothetical protein